MSLSTPTTSFTCSIDNGLAHLVLDAPTRGNPIDGVFCNELNLAIAELSERADVRCVLMSANGKLFSVGGDLAALADSAEALPRRIKQWTSSLHAALVRMMRMRAPVVVAIHGNVAGGSVSLMAACDVVVIARSARITSAFAKIGFTPDSGSTTTVTARMGVARTKRFFLLGETLTAEDALAAGLVDRLADDAAVRDEAMAIARDLAAGPTEAFGGIKRLFLQTLHRSVESQMEDEAQTLAAVSRSVDAQEGIKAFRDKRKPVFRGT